jgi:ferric uptake regulation protein
MNDPMLTQAVEAKLAHRDIRATSSRILVLRTLMTQESALALSDLEAILPTLDKSTLFRTLTTFAAHHLVHIVEDGSGLAKYALCADDCHCGEDENDELADLHTHFYCERCQRTFCLRGVPVPIPKLPEGFSVRTVGFVVKGICDKCSGTQP